MLGLPLDMGTGKFLASSKNRLQLLIREKNFGGRHGVRTHDPHVANVVLSQLS